MPEAKKIGLDYYGKELEIEFPNEDAAYEYTKAIAAVSLNGEPMQRAYGDVTNRNPGEAVSEKEPAKLMDYKVEIQDENYKELVFAVKTDYYHIVDVTEGWDDAWNEIPENQMPPAAPSIGTDSWYPSRWTFDFDDSYYWYKGIFETRGVYEDLVFYVTKDGEVTDEEPEALEQPEAGKTASSAAPAKKMKAEADVTEEGTEAEPEESEGERKAAAEEEAAAEGAA